MAQDNDKELIFDSSRFYSIKQEQTRRKIEKPADIFLVDPSDAYANQGMVLGFHHIPSGKNVYFKAFITAFNETYNSDWTSEIVYGRADPIVMFKNTTRTITLGFKIPAASISEGYENLANVGMLSRFLYPYYTQTNSQKTLDATTIAQSPLVRIKVMNLLTSNKGGAGQDFESFISSTGMAHSATKGLLGIITSVSINHNLENDEAGVIETSKGTILPKLIEVSVDFQAIHEHPLGWTAADAALEKEGGGAEGSPGFQNSAFPYGLLDPNEKSNASGATAQPIAARLAKNAAAAKARKETDNEGANLGDEAAEAEAELDENGLSQEAAEAGDAAEAMATMSKLTSQSFGAFGQSMEGQAGYTRAQSGPIELSDTYGIDTDTLLKDYDYNAAMDKIESLEETDEDAYWELMQDF